MVAAASSEGNKDEQGQRYHDCDEHDHSPGPARPSSAGAAGGGGRCGAVVVRRYDASLGGGQGAHGRRVLFGMDVRATGQLTVSPHWWQRR